MQLWILASEYDGKIPFDLEEIKFRLRDDSIKSEDVNHLIKLGFFNDCKHMLASDSAPQAVAVPETETETETETELKHNVRKSPKYPGDFLTFWALFPPKARNRSSKKEAFSAFKNAKSSTTIKAITDGLKPWLAYWAKDNGEYALAVHRWINRRKWEDPPETDNTVSSEDYGRKWDELVKKGQADIEKYQK